MMEDGHAPRAIREESLMRTAAKIIALVFGIATMISSDRVAAQTYGDFGGKGAMRADLNNQPKSYKYISDPTGSAFSKKVHRFRIGPGCNTQTTGDEGYNDCMQQSVRSQITEQVERNGKFTVQPKQRWYGWDMYIPADFPLAPALGSGGYYTFVEWHNGQCPHISLRNSAEYGTQLYLETARVIGQWDCAPEKRIPIIDLKQLVNGWHRFEAFADWQRGPAGKFVLYVDGQEVLNYQGDTLTEGQEAKNYFMFGVYLCCTTDAQKVRPGELYFANVWRGKTREDLPQ